MSKLKIYKASAGSGKTFKLTEEYLRLLFKEPSNYKKTLAVTFTNKATEEMKLRIISELYKLSDGEKTAYYTTFINEFAWTPEVIKQKAGKVLNNILHDYSKFSVATIDSFFQKVIKSFAKEIGLYSGYTIELDNEKILSEATDNLFAKIGENENTKKWLLEFAEEKIKDGKSWNLKNEIQKLGYEIFKEEFLMLSDTIYQKINNKKFLKDYYKELMEIKAVFEKYMKSIAVEAIKHMELYSLTVDDFAYGNQGVAGYFKGVLDKNKFEPGKRAISAMGNTDKWYSKSSNNKDAIVAAVTGGLDKYLSDAVEYYDKNAKKYNTVNYVLRLLHSLGILTDVARQIVDVRQKKNIFLLSDAVKFLKTIINDEDTPFVYEKIGSYYKHFMIDEFQDTSSMQWSNFKPLILNSLSENNTGLLVGDVKQSIYRWRNSDWKLLAEQVFADFRHQGVEEQVLDTNWRSKKNIVYYNNTVFKRASFLLQNIFNENISDETEDYAEILRNRIKNAYGNLKQYCNDNEGGIIRNYFIDKNDFEKKIKSNLPKIIEKLQDSGVKAGDIAILVRKHQEGAIVANTFLEYKNSSEAKDKYNYNIISNESLYVNTSLSVKLLIALLRYFIFPEDKLNNALLVSLWKSIQNNSVSGNFSFFAENLSDSLHEHMPHGFISKINKINSLPLYELVAQLIKIFSLNNKTSELPYIAAFLDIVLDFAKTDIADIKNFLDWWDDEGNKQTINTPDNSDAIRIITIHKSKGLEFEAVIIPFCNWELDNVKHQKIIWCKPNQKPFDKIELLPVKYNKGLKHTIFYKEYYNEVVNNYIDNLNLMYVAFTRAKSILVTFSEKNTEDKIKTVADVLFRIIKTETEFYEEQELNLCKYWSNEDNMLSIGIPDTLKYEQSKDNSCIMTNMAVTGYENKLKLKLGNKDFFNKSRFVREQTNKGNILHKIFENITKLSDVDKAIETVVFDGLITSAEKKYYKDIVTKALTNPFVRDWFSGKYDVITEMSVITPDGRLKRPDRVMLSGNDVILVDYKFGEEEHNSYVKQIEEYNEILKEMNYKPKSYIWYVVMNKIVEIK